MSAVSACATLARTCGAPVPLYWPDEHDTLAATVPASPAELLHAPVERADAPVDLPDQPAGPGWVARALSFGRFALVGSASTALSSLLFLLLGAWMPATLANTLATVVTTVGSNQAHARWTFNSGRRGAGMHLRAGLSVALTYPITTVALLGLERVHPGASAWLELIVLLGASAAAGLLRYVLLLVGVFPDSPVSFRAVAEPAVTVAQSR
jgi:putative flippase GtrA